MTRDKQIEEMAKITCLCNAGGFCECDGKPCDLDCSEGKAMARLYNAGYRKSADVAEDIIRMLRAGGINEWRYPVVAEIKKKYTEE